MTAQQFLAGPVVIEHEFWERIRVVMLHELARGLDWWVRGGGNVRGGGGGLRGGGGVCLIYPQGLMISTDHRVAY